MKILLLSAYHAESHKHWCDGLIRHLPQHQWNLLSLPPRHFAWRVRGNSLSWAFSHKRELSTGYDLLIATSLVDLAALRGFVPALGRIPNLVYFHENQFEYPHSGRQQSVLEPQIVNLYTALCADKVVFNSAWNRDSFLAGVTGLLDKLPDHVPPALAQRLLERSSVLPVGLDPELFTENRRGQVREFFADKPGEDSLIITWAARWEYDKGPDRLLEILRGLDARDIDFRLNILGQSFRRVPEEFATIRREFASRMLTCGYVESRKDYTEILRGSDIVLSTARHEFQGLAVLEGVACGCSPVVPDAVVYPELFASEHRYKSVAACVELLATHQAQLATGASPAPDVSSFSWRHLAPRYQAVFESLCADPVL